MSTLSLRLPESIHEKLGQLAKQEGISINQLINSAVAEKLAALLTERYLEERARRANRSKFDAVLAKIPDVAPIPGDELPAALRAKKKPAKKALQRTTRLPRAARSPTSPLNARSLGGPDDDRPGGFRVSCHDAWITSRLCASLTAVRRPGSSS